MSRICFTLQVAPDRLTEYRERHAAVWPDMLHALADAGWRDYSLFLREDGLLIGYFLTDDLASALEKMARTDVNERWQQEMAPYFRDLDGSQPDHDIRPIQEIFNLEAQLLTADKTGSAP